jgi:hypothetical protein
MAIARVFRALTSERGGSRVTRHGGALAAAGGALGGGAVLLAALLFVTAFGAQNTLGGLSAAGAVGTAPTGKNAYEFVGRIDQDGLNFVSYGYLTYVDGLPDSVLFSDPINHGETTARITYYATATLTARSVISAVTELNALGTTTFYFDTGGANFADPASFANGTAIGFSAQRSQNIVNVQSPNTAIANNFGELVQLTAGTFAYQGQTYTFGHVGSQQRSFFTGEGIRTDPIAPRSFIVGAGNAASLPGNGVSLPYVSKQD